MEKMKMMYKLDGASVVQFCVDEELANCATNKEWTPFIQDVEASRPMTEADFLTYLTSVKMRIETLTSGDKIAECEDRFGEEFNAIAMHTLSASARRWLEMGDMEGDGSHEA